MNRIVREHYPVSNLPEDLQKEFPGQDEVTLVLEAPVSSEQAREDALALAEIRKTGIRGGDFSRFKHLRRSNFRSSDEVEAHVNALRDEWAHRER